MDYQEKDNAIVPPDGDGEFFAAYGGKHYIRLRNGDRIPFTPPTLETAAEILDLCDRMDRREEDLEAALAAHSALLRGFTKWFGIPDGAAIYPLEVVVIARRFFGFSRLQGQLATAGAGSNGRAASTAASPANGSTVSPTPSPTSPAPTTTSRTRRSRGRASSSSSGESTGSAPRSNS